MTNHTLRVFLITGQQNVQGYAKYRLDSAPMYSAICTEETRGTEWKWGESLHRHFLVPSLLHLSDYIQCLMWMLIHNISIGLIYSGPTDPTLHFQIVKNHKLYTSYSQTAICHELESIYSILTLWQQSFHVSLCDRFSRSQIKLNLLINFIQIMNVTLSPWKLPSVLN